MDHGVGSERIVGIIAHSVYCLSSRECSVHSIYFPARAIVTSSVCTVSTSYSSHTSLLRDRENLVCGTEVPRGGTFEKLAIGHFPNYVVSACDRNACDVQLHLAKKAQKYKKADSLAIRLIIQLIGPQTCTSTKHESFDGKLVAKIRKTLQLKYIFSWQQQYRT